MLGVAEQLTSRTGLQFFDGEMVWIPPGTSKVNNSNGRYPSIFASAMSRIATRPRQAWTVCFNGWLWMAQRSFHVSTKGRLAGRLRVLGDCESVMS